MCEKEKNKNKELENKIRYQNEQIEGLKIVINKFADEREKILFNEKNKSNHNINKNNNNNNNSFEEQEIFNDNNNDKEDLKEQIKQLKKENEQLEQELKNLKDNNKLIRSDYKSEGGMEKEEGNEEEEYTMKKMINEAKKKNQSEDIKIDYPGLNNLKQKYDELEVRFRNLEEAVINLLNNLKCTNDIKPMILDVCNALEIGEDMIKQIIGKE